MSIVKRQSEDDDSKNKQLQIASSSSRPKYKMNILDEETYIKKLETIIEKSFFPDLERLKIQQAYFEAIKTNDFDTLRDLYSKYNKLLSSSTNPKSSTSQTPAYFDTPSEKHTSKLNTETPYSNDEPPQIDLKTSMQSETSNLSLDNFLAKNTSEDNLSFETLITEAEKKQKSKLHNSWLYEKEKLHKLKVETSLMLANEPKQNDEVTKSLDSWTYTSKNTLMYIPEGAPLTHEEELANAKNVRIINHANTRLSKEALENLNKQLRPSSLQTPKSLTQSINPITKFDVSGQEKNPKETPKIKGYSLVEPSPSPMPGRLAGDESPMMVWGEIESTPFRLDPSQTPLSYTPRLNGGPEFKIPDIPEREKIALNLEEKVSAERRKKKHEALNHVKRSLTSPSRNSSLNSPSLSDRINNMSPAAQRLLKMKNDKSSITSPLISPKSSLTTNSPYIGIVSPRLKSPSNQKLEGLKTNLKRPSDSLTDNLLKLPKNN